MSTEAKASTQAPADANGYKRALVLILDGMQIEGVVEVKDRGPRTFNGQTQEVMTLEAKGFQQVFYAADAAEHRHWPYAGDIVKVSCPITKGRDGGYKIGNPTTFEVLASKV